MSDPTIKLNCGYCGHEPTLGMMRWPRGTKSHVLSVVCTYCGAQGPKMPTAPEAIERWNEKLYNEVKSWDGIAEIHRISQIKRASDKER